MYKALTSFKVQNDVGEVRIVKRGDPVPEAAGWTNVQAYLKRQWIEKDEDAAPPKKRPYEKPAVVSSVSIEPPVAPPEPPPEDDGEDSELYTEKDLNRMSKKELQELAETLDIDPDQTKADLATCILLAQE